MFKNNTNTNTNNTNLSLLSGLEPMQQYNICLVNSQQKPDENCCRDSDKFWDSVYQNIYCVVAEIQMIFGTVSTKIFIVLLLRFRWFLWQWVPKYLLCCCRDSDDFWDSVYQNIYCVVAGIQMIFGTVCTKIFIVLLPRFRWFLWQCVPKYLLCCCRDSHDFWDSVYQNIYCVVAGMKRLIN